MSEYLQIDSARGVITRLVLNRYKGWDLIDLRQYSDVEGDLRPTKKGVSVHVRDVPRLIAGFQAAEADLLRLGLLEPEDYERAGWRSRMRCRRSRNRRPRA